MMCLVSKVGTYQFQESEIRVSENLPAQLVIVMENTGDTTVTTVLR